MFHDVTRVAIDESGDTGLKFDKNSSTHFAVALAVIYDPESLERAVAEARLQLSWPGHREFKFSATSDRAKAAYFAAVRHASFQIHALVFDKRLISPRAPADFYGHLIALALRDVAEIVRGSHVVLDESFRGRGKKRSFRSELRGELGQPGRGGVLGHLSYSASYASDELQLADMAVGAVARAYVRDDDRYLLMLRQKVAAIRQYP